MATFQISFKPRNLNDAARNLFQGRLSFEVEADTEALAVHILANTLGVKRLPVRPSAIFKV